jgi:metal-responsive CopG/Arc/MetJ family transcriptional regulator
VSAVRLPPEIAEAVDRWADQQNDEPRRSEAIRRLVELGLRVKGR